MKASCVIPSYRRRDNLPQIIDGLLDTPEISEVLIWNNDHKGAEQLTKMLVTKYRQEPVHITTDKDRRNLFTFGRWRAAMGASCGVVCTQDDDVLISPDKWKGLFEVFETYHQEKLCGYMDGGHIRYGIKGRKYRHTYQHGPTVHECWETLVGWGAVFQRDWVSEIFGEYFACQPSDELSYRKADRVFTVMLEDQHVVLQDEVHHLAGAASASALYRGQNHWKWNEQVVKRALQVLKTRP